MILDTKTSNKELLIPNKRGVEPIEKIALSILLLWIITLGSQEISLTNFVCFC